MQISNLVSQYNKSVANGEPMTGAKESNVPTYKDDKLKAKLDQR